MLQLLASNPTHETSNAFELVLSQLFEAPAIQSFLAIIIVALPVILFLSVIQAIFVFFQPFYFRSMKKSQKRIAEAQEDIYKIEKQRYNDEREQFRIQKELFAIEKERLELEKQKFELEKARLESQGIKVITTNKE